MFEKITPEQAGINSKSLIDLVNSLNNHNLNMHSMLFMKGDKIFFETYYKPFYENYLHRLYSETKSFVGIAIGLLLEEGKLSLKDPIIKYFPEYCPKNPSEYLKKQTIEDMLKMQTAHRFINGWFYLDGMDRLKIYFDGEFDHPSGTIWEYDSDGSHVLCALVEKLTNMKLLDYLKIKLFNKMGTFQDAYYLLTPTGNTWGDSAFVATLRDQASFGYLLMNEGSFNGEQLINKDYVRTATSNLVDNTESAFHDLVSLGYGYQIWHLKNDDFVLTGMGDQLTIVFKSKGYIFSCHASNQGSSKSRQQIIEEAYKIVDNALDTSLKENKKDYKELLEFSNNQEIRHLPYGLKSSLEKVINDKKFICESNQMNIKWFKLHLEKDSGSFEYENLQGHKVINFGRGYNKFEVFPEEGYSNMVGKEITKNYYYKCANSGCFLDNNKFGIEVEIIDKYFGNLLISIGFKDDKAFIKMKKNAENFLREYFGELVAQMEK